VAQNKITLVLPKKGVSVYGITHKYNEGKNLAPVCFFLFLFFPFLLALFICLQRRAEDKRRAQFGLI